MKYKKAFFAITTICIMFFQNVNVLSEDIIDTYKLIEFLTSFEYNDFEMPYIIDDGFKAAMNFIMYEHEFDAVSIDSIWYKIDNNIVEKELKEKFALSPQYDYETEYLYYQEGYWYFGLGSGGEWVKSVQPIHFKKISGNMYYIEADIYSEKYGVQNEGTTENFYYKPIDEWNPAEKEVMEIGDKLSKESAKRYYVINIVDDKYQLLYADRFNSLTEEEQKNFHEKHSILFGDSYGEKDEPAQTDDDQNEDIRPTEKLNENYSETEEQENNEFVIWIISITIISILLIITLILLLFKFKK